MHPHVPPVSRVTLFQGGIEPKAGRHPTFYRPLYSFTEIIFDKCLPENSKENRLLYIIKFFSCFYTVVERDNETTVKL